ncbi:STAS domain-containing protein [Thalassotalea euphylliae]|uniref:STAS domain-containing protein n=1 Tax=Thalassotalea euphylliae TaxID=1655234 RepID=A0A3E0UC15_9GAMM|nr:STAS domain-containing protein [Thalassotalea euphylliae]REL34416.1 STAS domain-containing protein [Thalassotalea euphylliae]
MLAIDINNQVTQLKGKLTSNTVATIKNKAHRNIVKTDKMVVNLAQVTDVDTAGLAWLLFLVEQAKRHKSQLSFAELSEDLLKLAQLSDVDQLLLSPSA